MRGDPVRLPSACSFRFSQNRSGGGEARALTTTTTVINTFEKQLARIYGLDQSDVTKRFRLGRFKDVRDRIAHEALRPPIHFQVLDFLSALYWDALLDILQLGSPGAAGRVLDVQNIEEWFPVLPATRTR